MSAVAAGSRQAGQVVADLRTLEGCMTSFEKPASLCRKLKKGVRLQPESWASGGEPTYTLRRPYQLLETCLILLQVEERRQAAARKLGKWWQIHLHCREG